MIENNENILPEETTGTEGLEQNPQPVANETKDATTAEEKAAEEKTHPEEAPLDSRSEHSSRMSAPETAALDETEERVGDTADPEAEKEALKARLNSLSASDLLKYLDEEVTAERLPEAGLMSRLRNLVERRNGTMASKPEESETEEDEEDTTIEEGEERGGENSSTPDEELQIAYINLRTRYQQLKSDIKEREKKEREENLRLKEDLLVKLEETLNSTGDFFKIRNERNNIVARWREIGPVPENNRTSLLDRYAKLNDQFYHQNKLEKEAMEEDYRHNRREKEGFIARAKELVEEQDIEKAFRELQGLHDRWKEAGPVAPEFRDAMWAEFKEASTAVNRRFDAYHQELHRQYDENYEKKKALIERLENMLIELPKTREAWRKYETAIDEIRADWKSIGRVPKDKTHDVNLRFRQAVDEFYLQRRTFMKELSAEITPKLEKMRRLVAEATELKEETSWRKTTDRMLAIQQEWKEVSNLGANVGEANRLWRQLRQSMDYFFGKKREALKSNRSSREENLEKKRDVAERLRTLWQDKPEDLDTRIAELQKEWDTIGPMPDAKKDEVMNLYYGTLREIRNEGRPRRGERKGTRADRQGEDRGAKGNHRRDNRNGDSTAQTSRPAVSVDLKKDVTTLDTKALQEERKNVKRAIADQNEELMKLETNLGFFLGTTDSPMFAGVQKQIDTIKERIKKYEAHLEEIKSAIKNSSNTSTSDESSEETSVGSDETVSKEIDNTSSESSEA